jgi:hypothetical protein
MLMRNRTTMMACLGGGASLPAAGAVPPYNTGEDTSDVVGEEKSNVVVVVAGLEEHTKIYTLVHLHHLNPVDPSYYYPLLLSPYTSPPFFQ